MGQSSSKKTINNIDNNLKIIMILDESGSMFSIKQKIMTSINDFIKSQKELSNDGSTFTLVKFSDNVNTVIIDTPLESVDILKNDEYTPAGCTALYDGIGFTIEKFKNCSNVIMVIVTDGQENASTTYNNKIIQNTIKQYRDEKNWKFVYLSCDIDTFEQGNNIGIKRSAHTSNCVVNKNSMGNYISTTLNSAISDYRTKGTDVNTTLNNYVVEI